MVGARRGLLVAIAAVMLVAVLPGAAVAEKTIGLSNASFEFSLAAGQTGKGDLYLLNDGDEKLTVMVYAADQVVGADGNVTYAVPNRDNRGTQLTAANWVRFELPAETKVIGNTPYLVLEPGDRVPLKFTVAVPAQSPPGDHQALLFFEMFDLDQALTGSGSAIGGRIGARLRVRVAGDLVERVDVRPFRADAFVVGDNLKYAFIMRNDGNIDKVMNVSAVILDSSENEKRRSELVTETTLYAGTSIERSGVLATQGLMGRYTLRLTAEYPREGGGQTVNDQVVKNRVVWVVPWWLFIVVVAILGTLLVYASWRQAVKAAGRKTRRERSEQRRVRGAGPQKAEDAPEYWSPSDDSADQP